MTEACRIPTPAERTYYDVLFAAEQTAFAKIATALKEAQQVAAESFSASGLEGTPPPYEYFAASMHQKLYCILCGADTDTFDGGDPAIAINVIRNSQNIAKRYWGADIDPYPRPRMAPIAP